MSTADADEREDTVAMAKANLGWAKSARICCQRLVTFSSTDLPRNAPWLGAAVLLRELLQHFCRDTGGLGICRGSLGFVQQVEDRLELMGAFWWRVHGLGVGNGRWDLQKSSTFLPLNAQGAGELFQRAIVLCV